MLRSSDRILVSHAGTLPRPDVVARVFDSETDDELKRVLPDAVKEVVRRQADLGIDIVNDGEFSKRGGFSGYVRTRMSGIQQRQAQGEVEPRRHRPRIARSSPAPSPPALARFEAVEPRTRRSSAPGRWNTSARPTCRTTSPT